MIYMSKFIGMTAVTAMLSMGLSTLSLSGMDKTVYDQPEVQTGRMIIGKVMNVVQLKTSPEQLTWQVFVKDRETEELVTLYVDQYTIRKDIRVAPDVGDNVIVKYNTEDNRAISFLADERDNK